MTQCYITHTGAFLPGKAIDNKEINEYMGIMPGEKRVQRMILRANGIKTRHYALDKAQKATHNLYQMACAAVKNCLPNRTKTEQVDYLAAGSTRTPLVAPGFSSILHGELSQDGVVGHSVEINSNSGICSSGAQAIVNAARAIRSGDATTALAVGAEHPSDILKSTTFTPAETMPEDTKDITSSGWFMSTFLRFMLSDGAGAFLLESQPSREGISLRVDWTYSRSFASEAPVCMQLPSRDLTLSQDTKILSEYMAPLSRKALQGALHKYRESLECYKMTLPHMSSYFFERDVKQALDDLAPGCDVPYWTNLASRGNTGSASIYIMLDEYLRTETIEPGDKLLLYVPESGQFNFVFISLTAVAPEAYAA